MARIFVTLRQLCLGGWCQFDGCYNIMISQQLKFLILVFIFKEI